MTVRVELRDRVMLLTLDRPERRNAVDHATLLALLEALRPGDQVVVYKLDRVARSLRDL